MLHVLYARTAYGFIYSFRLLRVWSKHWRKASQEYARVVLPCFESPWLQPLHLCHAHDNCQNEAWLETEVK